MLVREHLRGSIFLGVEDDAALLKSAGLLGKDFSTGDEGLNLAVVLLLGRDEVIRSVCPPYKTDAVWRVDPESRYDDRAVVRCNLVEAYDLIAGFCRKHMPDRFALEGDRSVSLRDSIVREVVANCLIHRDGAAVPPVRNTATRNLREGFRRQRPFWSLQGRMFAQRK